MSSTLNWQFKACTYSRVKAELQRNPTHSERLYTYDVTLNFRCSMRSFNMKMNVLHGDDHVNRPVFWTVIEYDKCNYRPCTHLFMTDKGSFSPFRLCHQANFCYGSFENPDFKKSCSTMWKWHYEVPLHPLVFFGVLIFLRNMMGILLQWIQCYFTKLPPVWIN